MRGRYARTCPRAGGRTRKFSGGGAKLLTRDYIVGYLWYCDGLPENGELTEDEYLPVSTESDYSSLAALETLLRETYTEDKADELLQSEDTLGRPRFVNGTESCISSRPVFSRYYWDYDAESVAITEETAETLSFTVTMENLHTGEMLPLQRRGGKDRRWLAAYRGRGLQQRGGTDRPETAEETCGCRALCKSFDRE